MKRMSYIFAAGMCVAMADSSSAAIQKFKAPVTPDFNHYNIILKRMPFGAAPAVASANSGMDAADAKNAAQEMKEQQLLARQLNMSCVNVTPSGKLAVGFTDLSVKPEVNYYLLVGDEAGGWTLKSADYTEEWAELEKDDITIFVKLGEGLMAAPPESANLASKAKDVNSKAKRQASDDTQEAEKTGDEQPVFKTLTEQMIAIATPSAPGVIVPPLPNVKINEADLLKAMETDNELSEDDSDQTILSKISVQEQKQKMAEHILDEGGSANSYLHRLRRRNLEEQLRAKQEQLDKEQQMTAVAKKAAQEAIQRREIMMLEEAMLEDKALDDASALPR